MSLSQQPPTDPGCTATRHGTVYAYRKFRCRCEVARRAAIKDQQLWMLAVSRIGGPLRVDSIGTVRRLRALSRAGWRFEDLAPRLHTTEHALQALVRADRGPTCARQKAAEVRMIFEELEQEPGPSSRTRARAKFKGWPGPDDWFGVDMDDPAAEPIITKEYIGVDEVAVTRLRGGLLKFESACDVDVAAAFAWFRAEGVSPHEAAELVGVDDLVALRYWRRMDRHAR